MLVFVAASIVCHTPLHLVWLYAGLIFAIRYSRFALRQNEANPQLTTGH